MATMATCVSEDWRLGPQIQPACRQFDFTLYFEATFLSAVPSAILLLCLSARFWTLFREPVKVNGGVQLLCKAVRALRINLEYRSLN